MSWRILFVVPFLMAPVFADSPGKAGPTERARVQVSLHDTLRDVSFEMKPDGKVLLTVTEGGKTREWKADSLFAFIWNHADVYFKYGLHRLNLPQAVRDSSCKAPKRPWYLPLDFMKEVPKPEPFPWISEFLRAGPFASASNGPELGVEITPVSEVLAAQLDMKAGTGYVVTGVKPGSAAEKAGIMKHDILTKLNGETVRDAVELRKWVQEKSAGGYELEVIRRGKVQRISVAAVK